LLYETSQEFPELTLGVDPGSAVAAVAVTDKNGKVVLRVERTVRTDISQKMKQRAAYRRNRRNRKTRYRPPRFDNRASSSRSGRLAPSVQSKVHSHKSLIEEAVKLVPVSTIIIEEAKFDFMP
jgi:predicted amino acid dehydrogenase